VAPSSRTITPFFTRPRMVPLMRSF
jgi:hypothetical protein